MHVGRHTEVSRSSNRFLTALRPRLRQKMLPRQAEELPGYGFSDKPKQAGWSVPRIATAWSTLMKRLG